MPTEIQVIYTVDVSCIVDVQAGEITRVIEYLDTIKLSGEFLDLDGNPLGTQAAQDMARASAIAENDVWPAWDRR